MTTRDVHHGIKSEYRFDSAWRQAREPLAALGAQLARALPVISRRWVSARDGTVWRSAVGAARLRNGCVASRSCSSCRSIGRDSPNRFRCSVRKALLKARLPLVHGGDCPGA